MEADTDTVDLASAQQTEDRFQSLFDAGAFNADGKPDPAQGQTPAAPTQSTEASDTAPEPVKATEAAETDPDYANVEDYLQKASIDRESFFKLPVRVKVDGQESDVPLSDLVKSYGLERHFQAKSIAFAEAQKAWEAQQAQHKAAIEQQLTQAQTLGNLSRQQLLQEYQAIDWNRLRMENPTEWAVRNTEFNQRANAIDAHLAQVQQQAQQLQQQQLQQAQAELPKQREKLFEARPEWRDDTKFQAARGELTAYAGKMGLSPAEIQSITDHRYVLILHDAARYAQLQAQAPQKIKQVRAAPQIASPGARQVRDPSAVSRQQAKELSLKNPRDDDLRAAYFEMLQ